jgi:enoyl-CoA hydratase/carnithine racemase
MIMSKHLVISLNNQVLEITLARPERKNALTAEMYDALALALREAQTRDEIRAVLLKGQDGVFCAGNDIRDFVRNPPVMAEAPVWHFFKALMALEKPLVAAVDGVAIGVGTTLLLHCDLVLATARASFALPFTSLGLTPEGASTILLPLIAGRQRASEMLLLGSKVSADRAYDMGLVTAIVEPEALPSIAASRAAALAALPGDVVQATKRLIRNGLESLVTRQFDAEREAFSASVVRPAAQGAFQRFLGNGNPQ